MDGDVVWHEVSVKHERQWSLGSSHMGKEKLISNGQLVKVYKGQIWKDFERKKKKQ